MPRRVVGLVVELVGDAVTVANLVLTNPRVPRAVSCLGLAHH